MESPENPGRFTMTNVRDVLEPGPTPEETARAVCHRYSSVYARPRSTHPEPPGRTDGRGRVVPVWACRPSEFRSEAVSRASDGNRSIRERRVSPFFRQKIGQSKLYSHCLKLMCDSPRRRRCEKCGKAERFLRGFSKHLWESVFFADSHKRGIFHNAAHRRRKKSGQDRV